MTPMMSILALLLAGGCGSCEPPAPKADAPKVAAVEDDDRYAGRGEVLARVNGVPIHELDVELALERSSHKQGKEIGPEAERKALDRLVSRELKAQRARELGLDEDEEFVKGRADRRVRLDGWERDELAEKLNKEEIDKASRPTESELREWFEEHGDQLGEEFHVQQILRRKQEQIEADKAQLDAGRSFEEVAQARFKDLPDSVGEPWDLGYLRWGQLPGAWRGTVDELQPGETSDIISGPGGRFWIVHLVDRRTGKSVSLEDVREPLTDLVRRERVEALRGDLDEDLFDGADIEYLDGR